MKKLLPVILVMLGLSCGACSVPLSPLLLLLKDQPAPLNQATPDSLQPTPLAPIPPQAPGADATGAV